MTSTKIAYLAVSGISFIASYIANFGKLESGKEMFGYVVVFILGLHLSYAYIFNAKMYAQGVSASTNEGQPFTRAVYGILGFIVIGMSYYGLWFW